MTEFDIIYNDYANRYIELDGRDKYEKVYRKIITSEKMGGVFGRALHHNIAPTAMDILSCIHTIPYFIFQGTPTCALAALIAIAQWNERINSVYNLCTEREVAEKAKAVFRILKMV